MVDVAGDASNRPRELEDVREQQRAISGVLRAVARASGLQPVLSEVAEACRRLCDADHGALWLLQGELLHLGAHDGEPDGMRYDKASARSTGRLRPAARPSSESRFR